MRSIYVVAAGASAALKGNNRSFSFVATEGQTSHTFSSQAQEIKWFAIEGSIQNPTMDYSLSESGLILSFDALEEGDRCYGVYEEAL